ncbi:MAG TPA: CocE/NonD family hydrolase [Steroidobacter sp.]
MNFKTAPARFIATVLLATTLAAPLLAAAQTTSEPSFVVEMNVPVAMRDGVRLSTDIYRPNDTQRHPVILARDPYSNGAKARAGALQWVERGYIYLQQDVRGRYDSEGSFYPYVYEINDGYDAQQWAGSQPWSSGKVGMLGTSYRASVQWLPAHLRSPALTAISPTVSPLNYYKDVMYSGGAFQLMSRVHWAFVMAGRTAHADFDWEAMRRHLPLKSLDRAFGFDLPYWRDWIAHPSNDTYWQPFDAESRIEQIDVPALNVGGWYDAFLRGTLASYSSMSERAFSERARTGQKLIVGPWNHDAAGTKAGELDFGPQARLDTESLRVRWFDHWLKGEDTGLLQEPPVQLFIMGENRWRSEQEWPLKRTQYTKYYLHSAGRANTASGDGRLDTKRSGGGTSNTYIYDPADPVPTRGGNLLPEDLAGPVDQTNSAARNDVLVFVTAPLDADTEVTGNLKVTLYAASSAPDTDFTAKLIDVHPDGKAYNLADGIIRARYRESAEKPSLIEPGKVYEYTLDLWATSNLFKRGHRIRLDISSSNFPRFDRNPNTGHKFGEDAELRKATQTVYHSSRYPSHVTLPVIPRSLR